MRCCDTIATNQAGDFLKLKFNNGKFKILLLGDIHEKGDYKNNKRFTDMHKMFNAALDEYKPDLCVLLGDNCDGKVCKENPEEFRRMFCDLIEPMTRRKIPVAAIMGNHEHDHAVDEKIVEICGGVDGCIMRNETAPDVSGAANFKEIIYSSDGERPVFCLWFIDSNNRYKDKTVSVYDNVHSDQIEWFESESEKLKALNGGCAMPSFVFQHIPVPEEYELFRKPRFWEIPISVKGHSSRSGERFVKKKGVSGYLGEGPCSPDVNSGQFASWKKVGGVLGAFFGHDHLNDFSGFVDGIFMAQHKTAGFRAYTDGCRCCVRLVTIDENEPEKFTQELKHFKEFGLKCECLGPIFKRITDRQSFYINLFVKIAAALAAIGVIGFAGAKIFEICGG